jgi:hypothetical protein
MSDIRATLPRMATGPRPDRARPTMPDGYGLPGTTKGMLSWGEVEQRLRESLHYLVGHRSPRRHPARGATLGRLAGRAVLLRRRADDAPRPQLHHNSACTLTLESGTEVVIVEGVSTATSADPADLGARLVTAYQKYHPDYAPGPDSWAGEHAGGLRVISPRRGLAWFAFPKDCTRFTF